MALLARSSDVYTIKFWTVSILQLFQYLYISIVDTEQ